MPNHTDNRVILSHADSKMIDMIYNIMNTEDTPLCQTLIPMPEELEGTSGFDENGITGWYSWRVENWGTKWDIYDAHCDRIDANTLQLNFLTAWSPPIFVFDKLVDMGFEVTARYLDEGWGYIGEYTGGYIGEYTGGFAHRTEPNNYCVEDVERVVTEYPELDYEFGISEMIAEMKEEEVA